MIKGVRQFGEIELKDFEYQVVDVVYNWKSAEAHIGVEAIEDGKTTIHHRYFTFPCEKEWTSEDVLTNLKTLDTFK